MARKKSPASDRIAVEVAFNPADLAPVKARIDDDALALRGFAVASDADAEAAGECLREALAQHDALEKMRKTVTDPLNAAKRTVDSWFKPPRDALDAIVLSLKRAIGAWEGAKLQAKRAAMLAASNAATAGDSDGIAAALARVEQAPTPTGVGVSQRWTATVINADLLPFTLPDEAGRPKRTPWWTPNEEAIAQHARNTPIDEDPFPIPGVKFTRETNVRGRHG